MKKLIMSESLYPSISTIALSSSCVDLLRFVYKIIASLLFVPVTYLKLINSFYLLKGWSPLWMGRCCGWFNAVAVHPTPGKTSWNLPKSWFWLYAAYRWTTRWIFHVTMKLVSKVNVVNIGGLKDFRHYLLLLNLYDRMISCLFILLFFLAFKFELDCKAICLSASLADVSAVSSLLLIPLCNCVRYPTKLDSVKKEKEVKILSFALCTLGSTLYALPMGNVSTIFHVSFLAFL